MILPTTAPRLAHNRALADAFLTKNKITCSAPPVSAQVPLRKFNRNNLRAFGYNPSIIRFEGRFLMAYRWHQDGTFATTLNLAVIDEGSGSILADKEIELPTMLSDEDPKLFSDGKSLFLSYVQADLTQPPYTCRTNYGRLLEQNDRWRLEKTFEPKINSAQAMEKNWVPFFYNGGVCFIYSCHPEHLIIEVIDGNVCHEHSSVAPQWPYGLIKGGTPPLPYRGKWLRFFHATIDTEPPPNRRRYFVGALLMEPTPPFNVISVSQSPLLWGSEEDDTTPMERSACRHRKPSVVFPGGAVTDKDGWLLSVGVNDCLCCLAQIKENNLKL